MTFSSAASASTIRSRSSVVSSTIVAPVRRPPRTYVLGCDSRASAVRDIRRGTRPRRLVLLAAVGLSLSLIACSDDDVDPEVGARDVCHQFVEERLRAPGTAAFESVDEAEIFDSAPTYRVLGHVDAENAFGGEVRTDYECTVTHTDGPNFVLVNLQMDD